MILFCVSAFRTWPVRASGCQIQQSMAYVTSRRPNTTPAMTWCIKAVLSVQARPWVWVGRDGAVWFKSVPAPSLTGPPSEEPDSHLLQGRLDVGTRFERTQCSTVMLCISEAGCRKQGFLLAPCPGSPLWASQHMPQGQPAWRRLPPTIASSPLATVGGPPAKQGRPLHGAFRWLWCGLQWEVQP